MTELPDEKDAITSVIDEVMKLEPPDRDNPSCNPALDEYLCAADEGWWACHADVVRVLYKALGRVR